MGSLFAGRPGLRRGPGPQRRAGARRDPRRFEEKLAGARLLRGGRAWHGSIMNTPTRLGICLSLLLISVAAAGQAPRRQVRPPTVPNSVCADCHEQEAKLKESAHASVACSSCHLKHEEYPHPENAPKPQCATCHERVVQEYEESEHAAQMRQGNGSAPECSTCHGDVHEAKRALTIEFHRSVPDTCGMCHAKAAEDFAKSVHGKAVAAGVRDAPVCSDCHGGHRVLKAKDPNSTVFPGSVPDTCGHCHGDLQLARRFGLPADRLSTFQQSFHGLALRSGRQSVADCASCHGFHDILPSTDPASRTHPKNLAATCGACHPGAGSRFALGPIHEVQGAQAPAPVCLKDHFIHIRHSGRIYDGYERHRPDSYERRFGPRLPLIPEAPFSAEGIPRGNIRGGGDPLAGGTRTGCSITPRTSHGPGGQQPA